MRAKLDLVALDKLIQAKLNIYSTEAVGNLAKDAIVHAYKTTLYETPQYSGHMVSNLTISTSDHPGSPGSIKFYRPAFTVEEVLQKGPSVATEEADNRNRWLNSYTPGDLRVTYSLGYVNEPDPAYYAGVEAGNNLRDVNGDGHALATGFEAGISRARKRRSWVRDKVFRTLLGKEQV